MNGRCENDLLDRAVDVCQYCGNDFCAECMVYPSGPKKVGACRKCALGAAGLRSNGSTKRAVSAREIKKRRAALAEIDSPDRTTFQFFDEDEEFEMKGPLTEPGSDEEEEPSGGRLGKLRKGISKVKKADVEDEVTEDDTAVSLAEWEEFLEPNASDSEDSPTPAASGDMPPPPGTPAAPTEAPEVKAPRGPSATELLERLKEAKAEDAATQATAPIEAEAAGHDSSHMPAAFESTIDDDPWVPSVKSAAKPSAPAVADSPAAATPSPFDPPSPGENPLTDLAQAAPFEERRAAPPVTESAPFEPAPFESAPFEPASFEQASFEPASFDSTPFEPAPFEAAPFEPASLEPASLEDSAPEPTFDSESFDPNDLHTSFEPVELDDTPFEPVSLDAPLEPVELDDTPFEPVSLDAPLEPVELDDTPFESVSLDTPLEPASPAGGSSADDPGRRSADTDADGNWIPPILRGMAPVEERQAETLPRRREP